MSRLVIFLSAVALAGASHAAEVSLRADVWYPMNGEPGAANPGFMVEIAQEALKAGGHTVNYQTLPWERAVAETRAGKFDCVIGAYKDDTPDFVFPDEPYGMDVQAFFVKKGQAWHYGGSLDSLKGTSVAVIGGYAYGDEFEAFAKANPTGIQSVSGDNALEQNLKKLLAGRAVTTLESVYVAEAKIKEMGLTGQIEQAGLFGEPTEMYIACSPAKPSSKDYAKLLTDGIRQLRSSGKLATILGKYGLKDWKK
ncbi:transporter substrate-binding domain-containing protein [Permianibacter sp. IMCC34836]|uniref:substrate-binding periplasmic protein n=1 Tax=Permianibacter fluminis TaxID=2738515 RepID=UPI00155599A9|nr:transporter substrate-binding domain-containing protein [Permianibacter fluminis]NQD35405.1 transporter substrate-binding domain-containing protein [Permianibacter fluminis]